MLSEKGKYAAATENRRFVWSEIIWPLILEINDVTFSLKQFQEKRERVCIKKNTTITIASRGLVSLVLKGLLIKEKDIYSIHYKLIPYMRLKANCDYATAIQEIKTK
jgi:hypothetical protein